MTITFKVMPLGETDGSLYTAGYEHDIAMLGNRVAGEFESEFIWGPERWFPDYQSEDHEP